MDLSNYTQKLKVVKSNPNRELAVEIYNHFGKKLPFPAIMSMIKRNGAWCMRELFIEAQKEHHELPLFMWRVKKYGTKYEEPPIVQ